MVGLLVVNPVEPVLKNVLEAVRNHHRGMAGNLAQGQRGKNDCATSSPAQVNINGDLWGVKYYPSLYVFPSLIAPK